MKKLLFLLSAAVAGVSVFADNWVYDPETKYVSDGVWTFNATVNTTTLRIEINGYVDYPRELSELDFSKPVTDGDGNTYTISTLNCKFCDNFGNQDQYRASEAAPFVGKITLPGEGLVTISSWAFGFCSNMSGTIRFPDTLKTIGNNAFMNCKSVEAWENAFPDGLTTINRIAFSGSSLSGDIKLLGKVSMPDRAQFSSTRITSVTFGTNAVSLAGAWNAGPFYGCTSLTNVYFPSDGELCTMSSGGAFEGCSALEGAFDLRRFKTLGSTSTYPPFSGSHVSKLIIGTNTTSISANFYQGAKFLKEVEFLGKPPATLTTPQFSGTTASQLIITYVPESCATNWDQYAEGGKVNDSDSVWSTDYVAANMQPYRFLLYRSSGGGGGDLGEWILRDDGVIYQTNSVWSFSATRAGTSKVITLDGCLTAPSEPSKLDLSGRITDAKGEELYLRTINTAFGVYNNRNSIVYSEAGSKVSEVVLPTNVTVIAEGAFCGCTNLVKISLHEGITQIGRAAFAKCSKLTDIDNIIPYSLSSLGAAAYHGVGYSGAVDSRNLKTIEAGTFLSSKITSFHVGAKLKTLVGDTENSALYACGSLTNITHDAEASGVDVGQMMFEHCSKLSGDLDLRWARKLETRAFTQTKLTNIYFGKDLESYSDSFHYLGGTKHFWFEGRNVFKPNGKLFNSTGTTPFYFHVPMRYMSGWATLAEGEVLNKKTSCFKASLMQDGISNTHKYILVYGGGLMMIVK